MFTPTEHNVNGKQKCYSATAKGIETGSLNYNILQSQSRYYSYTTINIWSLCIWFVRAFHNNLRFVFFFFFFFFFPLRFAFFFLCFCFFILLDSNRNETRGKISSLHFGREWRSICVRQMNGRNEKNNSKQSDLPKYW